MTHFLDALHGRRAVQARADPERCITPAFREHDLKQLTLRHLRYAPACVRCRFIPRSSTPYRVRRAVQARWALARRRHCRV